ncbi:hypothetical protein IOCL2690_000078300 [Leishmania lindenbergi]|uniref:Uncharacterized protein n=1 Tax=Leishmania lindenbergi TaxID=651832 RepID=A0AAW3B0I1_9TRYP
MLPGCHERVDAVAVRRRHCLRRRYGMTLSMQARLSAPRSSTATQAVLPRREQAPTAQQANADSSMNSRSSSSSDGGEKGDTAAMPVTVFVQAAVGQR